MKKGTPVMAHTQGRVSEMEAFEEGGVNGLEAISSQCLSSLFHRPRIENPVCCASSNGREDDHDGRRTHPHVR
ncbi:MAG: hypothetical protein LZF62_340164 [Nitrospira sp.]|nr:MAG: hypothetical protein LZF62_340164 [Nitrospira sp.]